MPACFAARLSYFTFITRRSFTHDFTCISSPSSQMGGGIFFALFWPSQLQSRRFDKHGRFLLFSQAMENREAATSEANYLRFFFLVF